MPWPRDGTRVTLKRLNNCGSKDIYDIKILAIKTAKEQKDKLLIKTKV